MVKSAVNQNNNIDFCKLLQHWFKLDISIVPLKNNGPHGWQYGGGFPENPPPTEASLVFKVCVNQFLKVIHYPGLQLPHQGKGRQARQRPQHWAWWPRPFTKTELRQVEVRTLLRAGTPLPQIAKQASNNIMIPSSRNPCSQCFNQHVSAFASVHIVTTKTLWISFPWFYNSPGGLWQEVDHEGTGQAGRGDRGGEEQVLRGDQPGFDGEKQWKTS